MSIRSLQQSQTDVGTPHRETATQTNHRFGSTSTSITPNRNSTSTSTSTQTSTPPPGSVGVFVGGNWAWPARTPVAQIRHRPGPQAGLLDGGIAVLPHDQSIVAFAIQRFGGLTEEVRTRNGHPHPRDQTTCGATTPRGGLSPNDGSPPPPRGGGGGHHTTVT